jgi:glycogen(starch) synthase
MSLKILVISNLYPPHYEGGYELGCRDVVDGLKQRGHDICVLTSTYGVGQTCIHDYVHRQLLATIKSPVGRFGTWFRVIQSEVLNQMTVKRVIHHFQPQIIYIWNIAFIPLSIALVAEVSGCPVVYYVSDEWPTKLELDFGRIVLSPRPAGLSLFWTITRFMLRSTGFKIPVTNPKLENVHFTSDFIRSRVFGAGYKCAKSWIIPWAVDSN